MPKKKISYKLEKGLLRPGTKSKPVLVKKGKHKFVFKVFGRGALLSREDARVLCRNIVEYHEKLKATGLRVSTILGVSPIEEIVQGTKTGRWLLATKEQFIGGGKDLLQKIASCKEGEARNLFKQLLEQLNLVTSYQSPPNMQSTVLIDPVPKNWVEGRNGKIVYIDFFTPKLLDSKGKLSPFFKSLHIRSRSFLQYRYQNKGGIYGVLLACLVAERPASRGYFERTIIEFLRSKHETNAVKTIEETIARNYKVGFIDLGIAQKIRVG